MNPARELWTRYESIHAVVYFHPTTLAGFEAAGLRGFWRGYFAQRAAPLGPIGEAPVRAAFFGFAKAMTARALPAVWDIVTPEQALALRLEVAATTLRELLGEDLAEVTDDLWEISTALPCDGRVLGGANAAIERPGDPVQRLWQATTTLREHRGDGHVIACAAAGLSDLEMLVMRGAADLEAERLQAVRGWTDDEWGNAHARLAGRGLLGTDTGRDVLADIEGLTDSLFWNAWLEAGGTEADARRISAALTGAAEVCRAVLPDVNPIGLPSLAG